MKIAITGGIGVGKSTLLNLIKNEGIKVVSCDNLTNEAYENETIKSKILTAFPKAKIQIDAIAYINKQALSKEVFSTKRGVEIINSIVHPFIIKKVKEILVENENIVIEVPLLFECNMQNLFDYVVILKRNYLDRELSVKKRSNLTSAEFLERVKAQFDYNSLPPNNKYVIIENNGSEEKLLEEFKNIVLNNKK